MLFVYGTLQDADILGAVLGRIIAIDSLRRATAPGYRAVTYPGRVYPALVAAGDDAAPGHLVTDLTELDLAVLDAFEGDEYRRVALEVLADRALQKAEAFLPVRTISAVAPVWSLAEWTATHKRAVLDEETGTAAAMRQRLTARQPP